ncbi:MAG: hypothetical protein H0X27_03010 [Caulobacteraceae bacterium]|nr:hypothetical protein [Caulobacteraceae bacterium]
MRNAIALCLSLSVAGVADAQGVVSGPTGAAALGAGAASLGGNIFTATQTIIPQANTTGLVVTGGSIINPMTANPGISVIGTIQTTQTVDGAGLLIKMNDINHGGSSTLVDVYGASGAATSELSLNFGGTLTLNGNLVLGSDAASSNPPFKAVQGTGLANGMVTNGVGGMLILQGGQGTGSGAGGAVRLSTAPPGMPGTSVNNEIAWLTGDAATHHQFGGNSPTFMSCGGGTKTFDAHATDSGGQVNISGTTTPNSCTIVFKVPYAVWNHCILTHEGIGPANFAYSYLPASITFTAPSPGLTGLFDYMCEGA